MIQKQATVRYASLGPSSRCCVLAIVVLLISGCAKPPDEKMAQVRLRFEQSDTTECARLVPSLYSEAIDSFVSADSDMVAQSRAFFLMRTYGRTEKLLTYADSLLSIAVDSASQIVRRFASEVGPLREQASGSLGSAVAALDSLENASGQTQSLKAMRGRLVSLRILLARADSKLAAGRTVEAAVDYQTVIAQVKETSSVLGQTQ